MQKRNSPSGLPTGVRRTATGYQAQVKVRGKFYSKRFEKTSTLTEMRHWRDTKRVAVRIGAVVDEDQAAEGQSFADDVAAYLLARAGMPTFDDQARMMRRWAEAFPKTLTRAEISPLQIQQVLGALAKGGYANNSINNHRSALQSFYTHLNGKSGYNPVRDTIRLPDDSLGVVRAISMRLAYRVLACMRPSQTRARLRLMAWTGFPHSQIKKLKPEHIDKARERIYATPRRKGKGHAGVWLPLLPGALVALKDFEQWDCYGPFSNSAMHSALARAIDKLNAHRAALKQHDLKLRPYDFRHTFGTWVAERVTDERAIQELMLHSTAAQTRRYTERATAARVAQAVAILKGCQ